MSVSLAAGDNICGWSVVMDWSGSPPSENVKIGRCDFLYSGAFWLIEPTYINVTAV